jgi:hypothetical protein
MDDLAMRGGLGGAMGVTSVYASRPLRVTDGRDHYAVVSDYALMDFGVAATYDRYRFYLNMDAPLVAKGQDAVVGNYQFTAPLLDIGSHPDTLGDVRLGVDARLLGEATSAFRLGVGAQLFVPNGTRTDTASDGTTRGNYVTDGTYRGMGRVLVAGDVGHFAYAGHLGVHVRPLDDSPTPGSPQGSELVFGAAGGARFEVPGSASAVFIVGPELYGATALRSFFGAESTALEALLSARVEGTGTDGPQLRLKLGTGAGLDQHFGAPEWRLVFGLELFARLRPTSREAP